MTTQYGRSARVTVGSTRVESDGELGLRVAFSVSKSTKLTENSARIMIYNLSEDTRSRLSEEASKLPQPGVIRRVVVEAGYGEERKQIFAGDKAWIGHSRQGVDWVTTIESLDGAKALESQVNVSYAPRSPAKTVFQDLKDRAKLAWDQLKDGEVSGALDAVVYGSGKSFTGSMRQALAEIADDAGLEVSVQDGEILFHKPDGRSPDTGLVLSASTGLIGTPETFQDPARKTKSESGGRGSATKSPFGRNKNLVRGRALLNGLIAPGRRFVLDSTSAAANAGSTFGVFRAIRVQHTGDTHGGDESWLTHWEAEEVSK